MTPPSSARDGDDRVVLDVELLLVTDAVLALEDEVGGGESGVRVALGDVVGGEHVLRDERIEDRRERLGDGGERSARSRGASPGRPRRRSASGSA